MKALNPEAYAVANLKLAAHNADAAAILALMGEKEAAYRAAVKPLQEAYIKARRAAEDAADEASRAFHGTGEFQK